jgi:hypothetical protein
MVKKIRRLTLALSKKETLNMPLNTQKISTLETGRFTRSLILNFYCHVHFCYFSHTKVANLAFLPDFSPIGILPKFLVWTFSGPLKTQSRPQKSKYQQKIFLTAFLYGICPLWTASFKEKQN